MVNSLSTLIACAKTAASCSASLASSAAVGSGNGSYKIKFRLIQLMDDPTTNTDTHDIVNRKNTGASFELTPPPIFVSPIDNFDHIALLECKFARLCGLKGMQRTDPSDNRNSILRRLWRSRGDIMSLNCSSSRSTDGSSPCKGGY